MQATQSDITLPRKLKRPMFVFFRRVSVALIVALTVCAAMRGETALWLTLMFGGSLWLVLGFILLCNWQVVTLHEDRIDFVAFGRKHVAHYKDIRAIKAEPGLRGVDGPIAVETLWIHHTASQTPLKINLENLAADERAVLLQVIDDHSPKAQFNAYARAIRRPRSES